MNIAKILKISIASLFIGIINCQYIICMDGKWSTYKEHTNKIDNYNKMRDTNLKKINDCHRIHETKTLNEMNDTKIILHKKNNFPKCTTELTGKQHTTSKKPMTRNKMNDFSECINKINRYHDKMKEIEYRDQIRKEMEQSKQEYYRQVAQNRAELEAEIYRYKCLIAFEKYRAKNR